MTLWGMGKSFIFGDFKTVILFSLLSMVLTGDILSGMYCIYRGKLCSRPEAEAERDREAAAPLRRGPVGLWAVHVLHQPDRAAAPQRHGQGQGPARRHRAQARRQGVGVRGAAGPGAPRQAQMQGSFCTGVSNWDALFH